MRLPAADVKCLVTMGWTRSGLRQKAPNSKLQAPKKHQAPSSKTDLRAVCPGICFWGLGLEIWNFTGAWGLVLGDSLSSGSTTEIRPPGCDRVGRPRSARRCQSREKAYFP